MPHNWSRGTLTNSGRGGGPSFCGQSLPRALETPRGTDPGCSRCLTVVLDQLGSPGRRGKGEGPKAQAGGDLWLQPGSPARFLGRGGGFGGLSLLFKGPWEPVAGCGHYRLQGPSAHISHASNGEGTPQRSQGLAEDPKNASYLSAEQPADTRQAGCTPRGQGTEGVATPGRGGHSRRDLEGGAGLHRRRVGGGDPACGRKAPEMRIHA